jgi:prophage maintenance system killer protein
LRRPSLALAVALNHATRQADEWFDEPDDLERLERALRAIEGIDDPVTAAATLAFRVAFAQAFGEGNKRTALLLARWVLDRNGVDGAALLPADDRVLADLLVQAAAGNDVEQEIIDLLRGLLETNPDLQIVATTHSPYMLDCMEVKEVRMTFLKEDGTTLCAPLTSHPEYPKWKDEMTPGEMWSLFGEKWIEEVAA